jgi:hypothetical protein
VSRAFFRRPGWLEPGANRWLTDSDDGDVVIIVDRPSGSVARDVPASMLQFDADPVSRAESDVFRVER